MRPAVGQPILGFRGGFAQTRVVDDGTRAGAGSPELEPEPKRAAE
jgi:hypothetical protein